MAGKSKSKNKSKSGSSSNASSKSRQNAGGSGSSGGSGGSGGANGPKGKGKHHAKKGGGGQAHRAAHASPASDKPSISTPVFGAGLVLLIVGGIASLMLVLQSLGSVSLPGCGFESDCARAAASVWGKVPGIEWLTTANIGLAYFLGVTAAWVAGRGGWPSWLRWVVRAGGVVSILLPIVMIAGGYVCMYCVTVHVANLAFVALVEWSGRAAHGAPAVEKAKTPALAATGTFAIVTIVLVVLQLMHLAAVEAADKRAAEESITKIIAGAGNANSDPIDPGNPDAVSPPAFVVPFTGRYRHGPESAPIRIVIISDYQCPDCKRIEGELRTVLANRTDVSFSAKHFPFCMDCNRKVTADRNLHPNACWAARAAEAAGILGGTEGFLRMHNWLFDQGGSFVDAELNAALPGLGFDPAQFIPLMTSQRTVDLVKSDIEEALELGLRQTPMIFINGEELRGWRARNALIDAVDRVAASNPPARTAAADQPPKALEKYIGDWQAQPVRVLPPDTQDWGRGALDAPAQVVVWGDYQEPITAELDGRLRAFQAANPNVRYSFRHYPIDQSCNPSATRTIHPLACRASQAVEAAGRVGGVDAYWRMHEWAFANINRFNDANLRAAAVQFGLDADALFDAMESPEVAEEIRADSEAAKRLFLRGVPFMFVNKKQVPFWKLDGTRLPERIVEEAIREGGG